MLAIFWLVLMVVLLVVEMCTFGLTTIWFAGGALVAFLVALPGTTFALQVGVFVAASVLLLYFTRPLAMRYLNAKTKKTNLDSLPGQIGLATETIDNTRSTGRVLVNGVDWSARTPDGEVVLQGAKIRVQEIQGVKLIVVPADRNGEIPGQNS